MNKPWLCACFALAFLSSHARAQFTDPRSYNNSPVGINQLELGYAHVHSNASIDTSLIITGAKVDLNQGIIDYTRYFGLLHRLTWVEAGVPVAGLGGLVVGTNIQRSVIGAGDSSYAAGILLKGGSALSLAEFEKFRPTTTVGVSLSQPQPVPTTPTKFSTWVPTAGRSSPNLRHPIHLDPTRNGRLKRMGTSTSTPTTPLITEGRSCDKKHSRDWKDT